MKTGNTNSGSSNIPKRNIEGAFDVPEGYFYGFENKILKKIELESELEEFKVLSSIQKINSFDVPAGYFDASLEYLNNLRISLANKKTFFTRLQEILFNPKFSFSYILIFLVGLSFYYYFSENKKEQNTCETLACIDKDEILNYALDLNIDQHQIEEWVSVDSLYTDIKNVPEDVVTDDELTGEINTNDLIEEL